MNDSDLINNKNIRHARGLRLMSIRKALSLSRLAFAERLGISVYSVQNWEVNKNNGLPDERIPQIITLLNNMNLICTFDWLGYGKGLGPTLNDPSSVCVNDDQKDELILIKKELRIFAENYPDRAVSMQVPDDSMEPYFMTGEYIAGVKHFGNQIENTIGSTCIVEVEEGKFLVRLVKNGSTPKHYNLICLNLNCTQRSFPLVENIKIISTAPVLWTRKALKVSHKT
jgi:transcriptional regulator with XRE-family HTH domain